MIEKGNLGDIWRDIMGTDHVQASVDAAGFRHVEACGDAYRAALGQAEAARETLHSGCLTVGNTLPDICDRCLSIQVAARCVSTLGATLGGCIPCMVLNEALVVDGYTELAGRHEARLAVVAAEELVRNG